MSGTHSPSYRTALAVPKAKTVLTLGVFSRLPAGLVPFAVIMAFTKHHGVGVAGLASGALMLAIALPGPARARWCSHRPPAALLLMTAASTVLLLAAAATAKAEHWQIPVLVTAAGGALFPPLTPTLRAIWSRIMPDKERLQSIHSLDSTVEELTFVATPLLGSVLMVLSGPELSMMVGALLLGPAGLGVAAVLRTVPPVDQPKTAQKASRSQLSIIRSHTGRGIGFPVVALGLCAGGLNVIIPAVATDFGGLVSSGYSFAAFSLGGVVGGLAYGRKKWAASLGKRYTVATAALAAGALILAALSHSPLTMLATFCVGLPMTPIFVIAYLLVDERIDPSRHPEANAWLGSGYNLGSASGAALGGQMLALTGARPVAAALAVVALAATAVTHRLCTAPAAPTAAREAREPAGLDEAASG